MLRMKRSNSKWSIIKFIVRGEVRFGTPPLQGMRGYHCSMGYTQLLVIQLMRETVQGLNQPYSCVY